MDYRQAEQSFQHLEAELQQGKIDEAAYRQRLSELSVVDNRGRTWMLQEHTGKWFVWNGEAWEAGTPPPSPEAVAPPPPAPAVASAPAAMASPIATPVAAPAGDFGTNIFGFVWRLALWGVFWIGLGIAAVVNGAVELNGMLYLGVVAAAMLAYLLWRLTRSYAGVIERVRVEQETDTDEDGSTTTRNVTYAYVHTTNDKVKKIKARRGFARGDQVYKRPGDWGPRKVKA